LRSSALVLFAVAANLLFSKCRLQALVFKIPPSAKLAVNNRPGWWNTGHLATLDGTTGEEQESFQVRRLDGRSGVMLSLSST